MDESNTGQDLPQQSDSRAETFVNIVTSASTAQRGEADAAANLSSEVSDIEPTSSQGQPVKACNDDAPNTSSPGDDTHGGGRADVEIDDESRVLSKIRALQDKLLEMERSTQQEKKLASLEAQWDKQLKQTGAQLERETWAKTQSLRAQSYVKDTTAFAFSREWGHHRDESFITTLMEREEFEKKLLDLRAQWEAKNNISKPEVDDLPPKTTWPQQSLGYTSVAFWDPAGEESVFNNTASAREFNRRMNSYRAEIHNLMCEKHNAFMHWKKSSQPTPSKIPDSTLADVWPRPNINYSQWIMFKYHSSTAAAFNSEARRHLFAVDVLDGEPDSAVSRSDYHIHLLRTRSPLVEDESEILATPIPKLSKGLIPERIRLNGPQFYETFKLLEPTDVRDHSRTPVRIVLLQPYRVLFYTEKRIREQYATLSKNFKVALEDHDAVSSQSLVKEEAKTDDAQHRDLEQRVGERPGTSAHSPPMRGAGRTEDSNLDAHDETKQEPRDNPSEEETVSMAHSKTAFEYLGCLIDFMDTAILPRRDFVRGPECRRVQFRDLWYLFQPGDEVISNDRKQVYRVIEIVSPRHQGALRNKFFSFDDKDTSKHLKVLCVYVDFDGKKMGPITKTFLMKTFGGDRTIESLEVYPLRLQRYTSSLPDQEGETGFAASDSHSLRQKLIKRGRMFFQAACMKLDNAFYNGPTADGDEVESQVAVDFETALSSGRNFDEKSTPQIQSMLGDVDDGATVSSLDDNDCIAPCCEDEFIFDDHFVDVKLKEEYIDSLIPKSYSKLPSLALYPRTLDDATGDNTPTDDEFLLMTYRVFAFVLRTRKWAELDLTYMEDTSIEDTTTQGVEQGTKTAFEQLVLPKGHKTIVLSLISQHYRNRDSGRRSIEHSDIVRGKGKGLILLLHGAPGVGKTSTAEGIAELFKKPLFTITCGDLGSTAKEVEQALDLNFNLANRWGCILLLDEADVFLASRNETDFERNGLVAVFLRVLEYYAGILFLTTNRVGVIDEAFRSRIHVSLYYPPLGRDETRAVFQLNLELIQSRFDNDHRNIKIDGKDIIDSALNYFDKNQHARWNGRQIRNACQTALALAEFNAQGGSHQTILEPNAEVRLAVDNFMIVSEAYLEFAKYLKQLYGSHPDVRAKEFGHRARETSRQAYQSTQQPGPGPNMPQPNLTQGQAPSYGNVMLNPTPAFQTQPYQPASMTGPSHIAQNYGAQQPNQQVAYYASPIPTTTAGNFVPYGTTNQASSAPIQQQNQGFVGMQFQPSQADVLQAAQPWVGQPNLPNTVNAAQPFPAQTQQQYPANVQLSPGAANLGSQIPSSSLQSQQSTTSQQPLQSQLQPQ